MGTASMTYYIETNLICLAILSILKTQYSIRGNRTSSSIISYRHIITVSIILCISDMVAGVLRGQQKPFIHVLQEISNIVFDISLTL